MAMSSKLQSSIETIAISVCAVCLVFLALNMNKTPSDSFETTEARLTQWSDAQPVYVVNPIAVRNYDNPDSWQRELLTVNCID